MSYARAAEPLVSVADFEAFLAAQPVDDRVWELIDGQIVGMTNPNARHGQIALNIAAALKPVAKDQGCRVNVGGLRVRAPDAFDGINATVPDVVVRCGSLSDTAAWIDDPTVVVEILSPSTIDFDRGSKLAFYKSFPSVADIILVYQDQVRVEHYQRRDGAWSMTALTLATDELAFAGLAFAMPLRTLYDETALVDG